MESKLITFHLYRYHLLPLTQKDVELKLFPDVKLSMEELKLKKNELFGDTLSNYERVSGKYPMMLSHHEDNFYFFKLAQKKSATISQNFKKRIIDTEPYVYVILNNSPSVQKIAISENNDAFSSPEVVKNILLKLFRKDLKKHGLNIEIKQIFSSFKFWELVSKYKDEITFIDFSFVKPNLAEISKALPKVFRKFSENSNSHESHITLKAPSNGHLEEINKTNSDLNGLVEYTSEGAGSIKLKVKNITKRLSTKENPVTLKVTEYELEGAADQVFKLYQQIVKE